MHAEIRRCYENETATIVATINAAAQAYRGVIPADCWHDPYMSAAQLAAEIDAGVVFWGYQRGDKLLGVMGMQTVRDVELIRHAYVLPAHQREGIGAALLEHLIAGGTRRLLVGTWAAASWAIRFYQRHGFELLDAASQVELLGQYWTIPDRQIETSVILGRDA